MNLGRGGLVSPPPGPSSPPGEARGLSRYTDASLIAILILCAALPYANTLLNGFIHDDNRQVLENPYIRNFAHWREIFTTNVWSYVGLQGTTNYYRPMMTFGYLLCYQLFGPMAYGFHLASVLLNIGVVVLLFRVTERLFRDRALAFMAAALFALHPIHSECVAWIAAVTDLQLAFFYLLTFWFYLGVARPGGKRSDGAQLGMAGSFVLAALAKEPAVTLAALATVYEHFYRDDCRETTGPQKLARYANLWLLALAYVLYRIRIFGGIAPVLQMPQVSWHEAFLSAFALVGEYLWRLLWPAHLSAFYAFRKSVTPLDPHVVAGVLALASCAALFLVLWKRARAVSFGLLWFFATLAPVLNARWMAINVFTERYLYLPSAGFCWIVAWVCFQLWARASRRPPALRRVLLAALGILAVLCVARIVTRNRDWRSDIVYYRRALAAAPDAIGLRINLGAVYWNGGNAGAAEREWRYALKLAPNNALLLNNLGLVCRQQKRFDEAVDYFQRSMRARPNYLHAHLNLGSLYAETGRNSPAELQLRTAVALAPLNIQARNHLGQFYFETGRSAEAEEQFRRSAESLANSLAYDSLGEIYARWNHRGQAEQAFRKAIELDDFDSRAHFGLATLYEAAGLNDVALREYDAGLRTDPRNPEALAAIAKLRARFSHGDVPKK